MSPRRLLWYTVYLPAWLLASSACECGGNRVAERLADLTVSPDPVEFGQVPVSTARNIEVTLANQGTATVQLIGLEVTQNEEDFSLQLPPAVVLPYPIAPGNQVVFTVSYRPRQYPEQDQGVVQIHSSDSEAEFYDLACHGQAVEPILMVDPVPVDFGAVRVRQTQPATLTINHTGSIPDAVTVSTIRLLDDGGGDFAVQQQPTLPASLSAGEQLRVNLSYTPQEIDDADRGSLLVESNAANQEQIEVPLNGSGFAPHIEVEPTSLDFGLVSLGERPVETFTITNSGNHELQVTSMQLSATGSQQFSLSPAQLAAPLQPLAQAQVEVTYLADHRGADDGSIVIQHDDPLQPSVFVQLHGRTPAPDIDVRPDNLTMRLANQAHSQSAEIRIYNIGDEDLQVDNIDFDNPDGTFSITSQPQWPATVAPGVIPDGPYQALEVTFETYQQTAGDTCQITIHSDDPDEPGVVVTVIGTYTP